jgi:hypothetical protein
MKKPVKITMIVVAALMFRTPYASRVDIPAIACYLPAGWSRLPSM